MSDTINSQEILDAINEIKDGMKRTEQRISNLINDMDEQRFYRDQEMRHSRRRQQGLYPDRNQGERFYPTRPIGSFHADQHERIGPLDQY